MELKHYVYAYMRTDKTPYYIGKGSGQRAWKKGNGEIGKPSMDRIVIVESNLTEVGALAMLGVKRGPYKKHKEIING